MKDVKDMNVAELVQYFRENPDFKGDDDITVSVNGTMYCIPYYCLTDVLWGMPDSFYPCDKYEWADHPRYFTSIEMVQTAIAADEAKFKAFILYKPVRKAKEWE